MNSAVEKFLDSIVSLSGGAKEQYEETLSYWFPDEPPVTALFAAIGQGLAEELAVDISGDHSPMFSLIESGMRSPDDELADAVATGLVESLAIRLENRERVWARVSDLLGPSTLAHAKAWLDFGSAGGA